MKQAILLITLLFSGAVFADLKDPVVKGVGSNGYVVAVAVSYQATVKFGDNEKYFKECMDLVNRAEQRANNV